ncbi:hypothetical protein ThvES_00007930 [Thiovulum sp. ES]|nr:hypothetical protein ThvES_00007930 [Thiovulum sp. ES]
MTRIKHRLTTKTTKLSFEPIKVEPLKEIYTEGMVISDDSLSKPFKLLDNNLKSLIKSLADKGLIIWH